MTVRKLGVSTDFICFRPRPTISSPHQANPIFLNGRKWRHVIVTIPPADQPPLPPQRRKRQMKPPTCSALQRTECQMMLPRESGVKFENHVKLFQTLISVGLATYLGILRGGRMKSHHSTSASEDKCCLRSMNCVASANSTAIVERFWYPIAVSHRAFKSASRERWLQPRFMVVRRKRGNQREAVSVTSNKTNDRPQPVATLTKCWQKFKRKMKPYGGRVRVGPMMQSVAKKVNPLYCLSKYRRSSLPKHADNKTGMSRMVSFMSSITPFVPAPNIDIADDSDSSISDSLSEFSCSL